MFGIGLGELFLVLIIVFFLSPKDLPKVMRKIGRFIGTVERIRDDLFYIRKEFEETVADTEQEKQGLKKNIEGILEKTTSLDASPAETKQREVEHV